MTLPSSFLAGPGRWTGAVYVFFSDPVYLLILLNLFDPHARAV